MTITVDEAFLSDIEAKAKAAEKVAPGPWEVDTEEQTDAPYKHDEFALFDANGRRFAGTENSDTSWGTLERDTPDEHGYYSMWNEPARVVTEFIRFAGPLTALALVAEVRHLSAENAKAQETIRTQNGIIVSDSIRLNDVRRQAEDAIARIAELETQVAKYQARLEIDHCFDLDGNRIEIAMESRDAFPDGIEARDATIGLMEDHIERLKAEAKEARRSALEEAAIAIEAFKTNEYGPDYSLASDEERRDIRSRNRSYQAVATHVRALKDKEPGQ